MRTGHPRLTGVLAGAVLILGLAACGSDSGDSEAGSATDAVSEAVEGQSEGAAIESSQPTEPPAEGGEDVVVSADNPIVLGFEISGPAGTVIETTTAAVVDATAQPELDQTWQLAGEPKWQLFSTFVDGAVMTLKVTEGGPATIVGFRGNAQDPNNPFAGYVVAEDLSTVELERGKISVLSLP
jgi:hypothetical protein